MSESLGILLVILIVLAIALAIASHLSNTNKEKAFIIFRDSDDQCHIAEIDVPEAVYQFQNLAAAKLYIQQMHERRYSVITFEDISNPHTIRRVIETSEAHVQLDKNKSP